MPHSLVAPRGWWIFIYLRIGIQSVKSRLPNSFIIVSDILSSPLCFWPLCHGRGCCGACRSCSGCVFVELVPPLLLLQPVGLAMGDSCSCNPLRTFASGSAFLRGWLSIARTLPVPLQSSEGWASVTRSLFCSLAKAGPASDLSLQSWLVFDGDPHP